VSEFLQRRASQILNRRLFVAGQKIIVAVSGGVDSMVLLEVLNLLVKKNHWQLHVAHFNHQLRGRSSDADEKMVRQTATRLKLPFIVERADIKAFAKKSKFSIEMAARKLRHEFLSRVARERKIFTVALGHHADDQVELFFLRLLRGAGGEGLAGMKWRSPSPVYKKITLVRPLLDATKLELLRFARQSKITFREDATNASSDFLRNRVRNELLPLLQSKYQPGLAKTVLRVMDVLGAESEAVARLASDWQRQRHPVFEKLPVAVQRRILQTQLTSLTLETDFQLIELLRLESGVAVSVSPQLSVSRNRMGVVKLKSVQPAGFKKGKRLVNLSDKSGEVCFDAVCVRWNFDARTDFKSSQRKSLCEFFDADKVGAKISLRHWQPGDRFRPIGLKSSVKLQDLFTNAKIPREQRHRLTVAVAANGEIFWIEGLRISESFKLTPQTKRRLVWRWQRP
jgi:tRNA(Ile)-lysidine synthase